MRSLASVNILMFQLMIFFDLPHSFGVVFIQKFSALATQL